MKSIMLSRGEIAFVDDDKFESLNRFKWSLSVTNDGNRYARRERNGKVVFMHSVIFGSKPGKQIDHKDGNGLNNQISNLRLATCSQNGANMKMKRTNTSGFKGVLWSPKIDKSGNKTYLFWLARITVNRKTRHVGYFYDKIEAAKAYDKAAEESWGEFALTNKKLGLI